jgi:hypothetical protein
VALACIALLVLAGASIIACVCLVFLGLSPASTVLNKSITKHPPSWLAAGAWRAPRHLLSLFGKALQAAMHVALAAMLLAFIVGALATLRGGSPTIGKCLSGSMLSSMNCPLTQSPQAAHTYSSGNVAVTNRSEA